MHPDYGVTGVKMSKRHPCQMLCVLMIGGGAVVNSGLRVAGTVCGRPLAHMPAPLSTLLTLKTPATPRCASPLSSTALYARIICPQKEERRRRWSGPGEGSPPPPSSLSCLSLCFYPGCLHPLSLQALAW